MAIPNQDLKKCTKCRKIKARSEYYESTYIRVKDGKPTLTAQCKKCYIKNSRRHYYSEKHDEILRKGKIYSRARDAAVRNQAFLRYGGYVCVCCGETEKPFLTLDHINNDGAAFRHKISNGGKSRDRHRASGIYTYLWLSRNGWPDGFQVLCMNCNFGKRMNKGVCPHQVRSNDYSQVEVGSSEPKRSGSLRDHEIVSTLVKAKAVAPWGLQ